MSNSDELFTRDELQDKFGWEEYLMFALLLLVSVAIGVFYWWRGQVRGTHGIPIKDGNFNDKLLLKKTNQFIIMSIFYQKSNLEFLLGGKDIGTLPITISLVVRSEKIYNHSHK